MQQSADPVVAEFQRFFQPHQTIGDELVGDDRRAHRVLPEALQVELALLRFHQAVDHLHLLGDGAHLLHTKAGDDLLQSPFRGAAAGTGERITCNSFMTVAGSVHRTRSSWAGVVLGSFTMRMMRMTISGKVGKVLMLRRQRSTCCCIVLYGSSSTLWNRLPTPPFLEDVTYGAL